MSQIPNIIEIIVRGTNDTKAGFEAAKKDARESGSQVAAEFSKGVQDKIEDAVPTAVGDSFRRAESTAATEGDRAGFNFTEAFGGRVRERSQPDIEQPLEDGGRKGGEKAGQAAAGGLSPLLIGAFTAAATIGPAAILAGVGTAAVGAAALLAKSNAQVAQDYGVLGQQIEATLTAAVSPITGNIDAAVLTLQKGVTQLGPQLDHLFASVGPDAAQLASGLVQLAQGALPGIVSGMNAVAPVMHDVAADFGKIGQGIGGLFAGLGSGVGGAATGFDALAKSLSELLPDVGQIVGALSNGLGPALRDVLDVANPLAGALTAVVGAVPPGVIEAVAAGAALLFGAFKGASLIGSARDAMLGWSASLAGVAAANQVAATTTGELAVAEDEAAVQAGLLAKAQAGVAASAGVMSSAVSAAAGPWGLLAGAALMATDEIDKHTKLVLSPFEVIDTLNRAYNTHVSAVGAAGKALEGIGAQFTTATGRADELTTALTAQREQIAGNAQSSAQATLAALGATDGQNKLAQQLYQTLTGYSAATTGASGYTSAIQALNGTTQTLDDAQNSLAQQMLNAKTSFVQNGYSLDLNTQSGINNRDALSQAAKAIIALGTAQYQATGDMGKANQTIQQQIDQFVKNTGATGKNKDAIYQYLESLAKIPPDVSTSVDLDTSHAYGKFADLMQTINTSTGVVHVYETLSGDVINSGMTARAKATGGPVGAAAFGGAHGSWTTVNEQGAELLKLPFGTQVIPASNTAAMAASGQLGSLGMGVGGGQRIQIEFVGDFFELIRGHVRARGGTGPNSVQIAFGQTY